MTDKHTTPVAAELEAETPCGPGRALLASHRHQELTPTDARQLLEVVGTGGRGLWERSWAQRATTDADLLAMATARELSRRSRNQTSRLEAALADRTEPGQAARHRFAELLAQAGHEHPDPVPGPEDEIAERFIQRMPATWESSWEDYQAAAALLDETGQHLVYRGLVTGDTTTIEAGATLIEQVPTLLYETVVAAGSDASSTGSPVNIPLETLARLEHQCRQPGQPAWTLARAGQALVEAVTDIAAPDQPDPGAADRATVTAAARECATEREAAWHLADLVEATLETHPDADQADYERSRWAAADLRCSLLEHEAAGLRGELATALATNTGAAAWLYQRAQTRADFLRAVETTPPDHDRLPEQVNAALNEERYAAARAMLGGALARSSADPTGPVGNFVRQHLALAVQWAQEYCQARSRGENGESGDRDVPHPRASLNSDLHDALLVQQAASEWRLAGREID